MSETLLTKHESPKVLGKFSQLAEKLDSKPEKISEQAAGYMELMGAKKDGGCKIVDVDGGISKDLGCCNLFFPESKKVQKFSCGTCHFED
jgi:hypothetical protein